MSDEPPPQEFFVWAPAGRRLALQFDSREQQLSAHPGPERGLYQGPAPAHGERYRLLLDDAEPLPDPRSRFQPDGVEGASEWVEPARLRRELVMPERSTFIPVPMQQAVFYELHVGTFTPEGTLDSAIKRLPHLVELGVTHVELMPVGAFMGDFGWGYDVVFPFSVHESYGGPRQLLAFVQACHEAGLAVVLDVVFNHLGPSGNVLGRFGPYFTDRYHTSWGDALNFDGPGSDQVRRFFLDVTSYWFEEFQVDALRLDAIQAIFDGSARHFLEELSCHVSALELRLDRPLALIAESHQNDPALVRSVTQGGRGMTAMWSDDLHHALHAVLTGERVGYYADHGEWEQVVQALAEGFVLDGRYSHYYQRTHGRPALDTASECFVVYLQNHDQVGNRASGDRIGQGLSVERLQLGMALVLLGPFVPMLFQGEEWNASAPFPFFADPPDEGLARAIRRGRLREYAHLRWKRGEVTDPTSRATFESARLNWEEREQPSHRNLLEWTRALLRLRKATGGCIPRSDLQLRLQAGYLTFRRAPLKIMVNCTEHSKTCALWEIFPDLLQIEGPSASTPKERRSSEALPFEPVRLELATPGVTLEGSRLHVPAWGVAAVELP